MLAFRLALWALALCAQMALWALVLWARMALWALLTIWVGGGKQGEGRWLHVPDDLVQGQGRGRRITITMSIGSITLFDTIMSLLLLCLVFALSRRDRSVITAGLSYMYCA